jgi:hypothetical protein
LLIPSGGANIRASWENINRKKKGNVPNDIKEKMMERIVNRKYKTILPL